MAAEFSARAPGKLVWLGEYAVLEGAPALALAVDRYARASLILEAGDQVRIEAANLPLYPLEGHWRDDHLEWTAGGDGLATFAGLTEEMARAGQALRVRLDSKELFDGTIKLGLGSSAATLVAYGLALIASTGGDPTDREQWRRMLDTHRRAQSGRGSGIDLAAALHGGLIGFESGAVTELTLPDGLHWRAVWGGAPASTAARLEALANWRRDHASDYTRIMSTLGALSARGVTSIASNNCSEFIGLCTEYRDRLWHFGEQCGIGIGGGRQTKLAELARGSGVLYKSCGAGGGDVGIALSTDAGALDDFVVRAGTIGCPLVALGIGSGAKARPGPALAL